MRVRLGMDNNTKMAACISFLLSVSFFLSVTFLEQHQRDERLQKLSDDQWCEQKLVEEFPDFPVITLRNVMNTAEELRGGINARPDLAKIVKWKTGQYPEYFRWFVVHQRELNPTQHDPNNHYHAGFITSDLDVYDLGLDILLQ